MMMGRKMMRKRKVLTASMSVTPLATQLTTQPAFRSVMLSTF